MLAIIAGRGRLPGIVGRAARAAGREPVICQMRGFPAECVEAFDVREFRVERLGGLIADLGRAGVTEICLAGAVVRPRLEPARIDLATVPILPRLIAASRAGDDRLLREVLVLFEERGMRVRAAHEIAPELMPPPGVPTAGRPDAGHERDAARAEGIIRAMAAADVGQACVVAAGQCLGVEALPGTDWMLAALARGVPHRPGPGLLYKAPKAGQDRRVDLPAIGPGTVAAAAAAGLSGIVIEAGGVMVIDHDEVVDSADRAGLFLWVRPERDAA